MYCKPPKVWFLLWFVLPMILGESWALSCSKKSCSPSLHLFQVIHCGTSRGGLLSLSRFGRYFQRFRPQERMKTLESCQAGFKIAR